MNTAGSVLRLMDDIELLNKFRLEIKNSLSLLIPGLFRECIKTSSVWYFVEYLNVNAIKWLYNKLIESGGGVAYVCMFYSISHNSH